MAPIAIFAFNRPDHLRRTLEALAVNELAGQSHVTFFCDSPRDPAKYPEDVAKCTAARDIQKMHRGLLRLRLLSENKT